MILGTHHDAWTFGGDGSRQRTTAVYETARGLATLKRNGWTPERTIVFAVWDAEEFGLVGSTEYAEDRRQGQLRRRAAVYINTDLYMRGRFDGGGAPSLRDFLVDVAKDVPSLPRTEVCTTAGASPNGAPPSSGAETKR